MRDQLAVALLTVGSAGTSAGDIPIDDVEVRIHATYFRGLDTEVPPELSIPVDDLGTGGIAVDEHEAQLVAAAARYVQSIAVLPTNEADERLIDDFMRQRAGERTSEPI
jgi:hypothetical protein